jgi:type IX secretion system PorP/SprF family membrane protein
MKKPITYLFFLFAFTLSITCSFKGLAQQDQLCITYPFMPLNVNPAYAGSREVVSMALVFRKRPLLNTLNAAATTNQQYFNFDLPIAQDKMAIGFQAYNAEQIIGNNIGGVIGNLGLYGDFAYRLTLPNDGKLAFGVQAGVTQVPNYISTAGGGFGSTGFNPSVGLGVYYHNDDYYVGISMLNINADAERFNKPSFITAGYVFDLGNELSLKTGVLVRRLTNVYSSTTNVDVNATAWFKERFGIGLWYQNTGSELANKAVLGSLQIQLSKFQLGYAYDFNGNPSGAVAGNGEGFHQIMLKYEFDAGNGKSGVFRFF